MSNMSKRVLGVIPGDNLLILKLETITDESKRVEGENARKNAECSKKRYRALR